ncbi:MAG: PAS domain S-box protein, partial [Betaproteobacteria bacterium]
MLARRPGARPFHSGTGRVRRRAPAQGWQPDTGVDQGRADCARRTGERLLRHLPGHHRAQACRGSAAPFRGALCARDYLSPRTLQLFGLPADTVFSSREDYLARTPIVREDLEKWQRAMGELFAGTGSRLSMEVRAIVHGEVRWMQHIGVCVRDASGRPARWCGTARDVTERRRTEEALRRSETYLAEAQKLSRTGSWAWNAKTKQVSHWSEEQYRMLGFDP